MCVLDITRSPQPRVPIYKYISGHSLVNASKEIHWLCIRDKLLENILSLETDLISLLALETIV